MTDATATLVGTLIGQAVGLLVVSFICAWVLSWRAAALRSWRIPYRSAYFVSVKAVFTALILGVLATRGIDYLGGANHGFAQTVGLLLGIVSWWFAHRSALLKLEMPRIVVWPKDARALSVSVFGFVTAILMASSAAILATIFVISLLAKTMVS